MAMMGSTLNTSRIWSTPHLEMVLDDLLIR
jgi:hypothetical protein